MAEGKGTPTTPKQEKEAQQSKPWTLKEWQGKPVWEWMQLSLQLVGVLAIPLVIAFVGLRFNAELDARQQRLAEQRTQDLTLQSYLDQMSTLVLEDLGSRKVQVLMRARTLTALERLAPSRKLEIMQFLDEADLVHTTDEHPKPVISLNGADLHQADLDDIDLTGAKLEHADLHGTYLASVPLRDASLEAADLRGAVLMDANLSGANLSDANLFSANLEDATLSEADLSAASLGCLEEDWVPVTCTTLKGAKMDPDDVNDMVRDAYLDVAIMPNGQKYDRLAQE